MTRALILLIGAAWIWLTERGPVRTETEFDDFDDRLWKEVE